MSLYFANNIFAAVMSSANYAIQSNNLTPSGGQAATSTNYIFRNTLGEVSAGPSNSASYAMRAGWQEMQETYLSVSAPGPVAMAPDIPGITGGAATGSATFYVVTDNTAGFNITFNTSTSPAMILNGSDITHYFSNYTATSTPDYNWSVPSSNAQFGFSVGAGTSADAAQAFQYSGGSCNVLGANDSSHCWAGFNNTSATTVINRTSRTNNSPGEGETINFKAQSVSKFLESGNYTALITATVTAN